MQYTRANKENQKEPLTKNLESIWVKLGNLSKSNRA